MSKSNRKKLLIPLACIALFGSGWVVTAQPQEDLAAPDQPVAARNVEHACLFIRYGSPKLAFWYHEGQVGGTPSSIYQHLGGEGEVDLSQIGSEVVLLNQAAAAGWDLVATSEMSRDQIPNTTVETLRFYFRRGGAKQ